MASVKVKLRLSANPYEPGTIYYQLTHRRQVRRLPTSINVHPDRWDARGQRIASSGREDPAPDQQRIDGDMLRLRRIIDMLEARPAGYTVQDIVERFRADSWRQTLQALFEARIDRLGAAGQFGTARNYRRAWNSFAAYIGDTVLYPDDLTESLIDGYNAYLLRRGLLRNSVSFYMRILRAVYNKAVRFNLPIQNDPFRNVYTGVDRTRKRAVDETVIVHLSGLDLSRSRPLMLARDLFVFSYCMRGMAFVDLAYLRKTDIGDNFIHYVRQKTGQRLCVKIEPCMRSILARYAPRTTGSPYAFPILRAEEAEKSYARYQVALGYYNRQLKRLSAMLYLDTPLTSYTARHSWATAARNRNVPISVISAGMGHTSERTTQIYLAALEGSVIDRVNRGIVARLNEAVSK